MRISKNLVNITLLRKPEDVKLVEQTQTPDLGSVAMKQEFLFNFLSN